VIQSSFPTEAGGSINGNVQVTELEECAKQAPPLSVSTVSACPW
jgi:hypothetical protein